jgi:hypothetical protein
MDPRALPLLVAGRRDGRAWLATKWTLGGGAPICAGQGTLGAVCLRQRVFAVALQLRRCRRATVLQLADAVVWYYPPRPMSIKERPDPIIGYRGSRVDLTPPERRPVDRKR